MTVLSYGPFLSRSQAIKQGLKYCYAGPCSKGHQSKKHVDAGCVQCGNERRQKKLLTQTCGWCGQEFQNKREARYCCKKCGTLGWKAEHPEAVVAHRKTEESKGRGPQRYQQRKARMAANPELAARRALQLEEGRAAWADANPEKAAKARLDWQRRAYANNLQYKMGHNLRARVGSALRAQLAGKSHSTMWLVGCSADDVIRHIESQFEDGMSWDNWALDGWHIDHIRPCASFDLTDEAQQRECFHYTNLQPLWAEDNLRKSDKVTA